MLRGTKPTRHRCEFASSVDSKSQRRKRARLQERILQVNKKGDWRETWLCASFRKSTTLKKRINTCFSKSIAEGIRCGPTTELRLTTTATLKQGNLIKNAKKSEKIKKKKLLQLLAHWGYTMWPNEGAASKPNEDSQAEKSYQGCKENKKDRVRKNWKKTSSIPCSPRLRRISRKSVTKY